MPFLVFLTIPHAPVFNKYSNNVGDEYQLSI